MIPTLTTRQLVALGAFVMVALEGAALVWKPGLSANDLFKFVVMSTVTGGLLPVFGHYFGSAHQDQPPK